ncbi:MAG: hypothetical protein EZS28_001797 [Streblomastix strix]|uniref:Uncharacterized protein n=1 Tax=Streblomastix strix TaxID=222440 RepID=A0A5J4X623_9EUKA|nr:MAG: hypothetical protein EZS28_001797 [Streblomastix strix]
MPKRIDEVIFDLRIAKKGLERKAVMMQKKANQEKEKIIKAVRENNIYGAQVHGENSVRNLNAMRLFYRQAAYLDALADKIEMDQQFRTTVDQLDRLTCILKDQVNDADIGNVNRSMEQFQQNMDKMGIQIDLIDNSMKDATDGMINKNDVDNLIVEVAAQQNLQLQGQFADMQSRMAVPLPSAPKAQQIPTAIVSDQKQYAF